jgi:hypothetical protein
VRSLETSVVWMGNQIQSSGRRSVSLIPGLLADSYEKEKRKNDESRSRRRQLADGKGYV